MIGPIIQKFDGPDSGTCLRELDPRLEQVKFSRVCAGKGGGSGPREQEDVLLVIEHE